MTKGELYIILVDDNDIDVVVNTKLLRLANLSEHIRSFHSGPSALEFITQHASELEGQFNVLLLDIQMPIVDGFETLKLFAELPESLRNSFHVFMLSSSIDRNDIQKAEQNPLIVKVLEKPLDVYLLKRLLMI